jgi:hypothetical protein
MSKEEFTELTIKIPKPVFTYLFDTEVDIEKYVVHRLVETVFADIEEGDPKKVMGQYNLRPVFKQYDVSIPPCYDDAEATPKMADEDVNVKIPGALAEDIQNRPWFKCYYNDFDDFVLDATRRQKEHFMRAEQK